MKTGIIIIDPWHGGMENVEGSEASYTVSALNGLVDSNILPITQLILKKKRFTFSGNRYSFIP